MSTLTFISVAVGGYLLIGALTGPILSKRVLSKLEQEQGFRAIRHGVETETIPLGRKVKQQSKGQYISNDRMRASVIRSAWLLWPLLWLTFAIELVTKAVTALTNRLEK